MRNKHRLFRFSVASYEVTGPNPLDESSTDVILEPFKGDFDDLEGLLGAVDALQGALNNRGYTFFRVNLPPQTLAGGKVILAITPLEFGEIKIAGNQHFSEQNIRASLPSLTEADVPSTAAIAQNLAVLNRHPSKQTNVRLKQSEETNTIDAIVTVEDQRPLQGFVALNNIGTRQTGRTRVSVGGQYTNLFNRDHKLSLSYTTSPENVSDVTQLAGSYEIPLYRANGFVNAFYTSSDVNVGQVGDFDVSGAGRFWGLSFTRILKKKGNYRHQWALGLQNRYFENNVDFLGVVPIGVDVRSFPLTLSYHAQYAKEKLAGSIYAAYVRNLEVQDRNDGATYALTRFGAESDWDLLQLNGDVSYRLPRDFLLRTLFASQWAGEALIPGEQFGLGGWRSVRGFNERAVTGDNGMRVTFETWSPAVAQWYGIRFLVFVDLGIRDREDVQIGEVDTDTLSSAGLGARWQWNSSLTCEFGLRAQHRRR